MKVFVIGGNVPGAEQDRGRRDQILRRMMRDLGQQLAQARFPLIACSPYDGTADIEVIRGWSHAIAGDATLNGTRLEMHCPDEAGITEAVARARDTLALADMQIFRHPSSRGADGRFERTYSWLLAQLSAMDRCNAMVAVGGNPEGSANLLLQLAAARHVPVLPLAHIGGAAAAHLERQRYKLQDRFGDGLDVMMGPREPHCFRELLETLVEPMQAGGRSAGGRNFFISYARERPADADFVEMTLRRRNCIVHRDEHAFNPGSDVLTAIAEGIHRADVFLALWCRDYACSPWCIDELELALDRAESGTLRVIILDLDGTRVVPRRARSLIAVPARTRPEIEASLIRVVETGRSLDGRGP